MKWTRFIEQAECPSCGGQIVLSIGATGKRYQATICNACSELYDYTPIESHERLTYRKPPQDVMFSTGWRLLAGRIAKQWGWKGDQS